MIDIFMQDPDLKALIDMCIQQKTKQDKFISAWSQAPALCTERIFKTERIYRKFNFMKYVSAYDLYSETEQEMIQNLLKRLDIPPFIIHFTYTTPKGQNTYWETKTFDLEEMLYYMELTDNADFDKLSAEHERSLMTPSLRFKILTRDNYRCVLCGRGASDGVKLQIDHIIPVSKGGKTTEDNLQTLCKDCNLGKSNKLL